MKIGDTEVYGFAQAFKAMRMPYQSQEKADSHKGTDGYLYYSQAKVVFPEGFIIGPNDMKLATKLIKRGSEHRKFLRQISITTELTLPRYVWTELDTYKVGTVRNSASSRYLLDKRPLTHDNFEDPIFSPLLSELNRIQRRINQLKIVSRAEGNRKEVKKLKRQLKQWLPESYLQTSSYTMNYEVALSIYFQRRTHEFPEWNEKYANSFCSWIKKLPYMPLFIKAAKK